MSVFITAWALQSARLASQQRELDARYKLLECDYQLAGDVMTLDVGCAERGVVYRVWHLCGFPEWFELLQWHDADDAECTPLYGPMPGAVQLEIADWLRTSRWVAEAHKREREHAVAMEDDRS